MTQAKTSSGYFKVDRQRAQGMRGKALCVPFHGIQDVVPGHGAILNDTIIDELDQQRDARPVEAVPAAKRRGWRPRWL